MSHAIRTSRGSYRQLSEGAAAGYLAAGVRYRIAHSGDEAALRRLLRENDMASWVRLSLEREPSYFAGQSLMGFSTTVVAHDEQVDTNPVGMYTHTRLPAHLNGQHEEVEYLGGLRVNREYRHRVRILRYGFESIPALLNGLGADSICFTSIARDNHRARRLLESNLRGMPVYAPVGEYETLVVSAANGRRSAALRRAERRDIPALVEFHNRHAAEYQFSPHLTAEWMEALPGELGLALSDFWLLEHAGSLRCCFALWDQRSFKQSVIRGYRFPVNQLRTIHNLWATLTKRPRLPPVGSHLEAIFIAFLAFDSHEKPFVIEVLRHALAVSREKGAALAMLGISQCNPVRDLINARFRPVVYRTCIDTVTRSGHTTQRLDHRPPQPEAALL